ncbi:putative bifunctional diguanylate cyclase/phosphodiesterase [Methylopila turkensis]|uniref:putative bifunctional diguanylate cyclase/phosphodiesterase n=1 Tax=Methylopila turkensis TaxID=1437816 RepID=UPI0022F3046A|nr:EAL domain-containing protein [Methylopila turkensis]
MALSYLTSGPLDPATLAFAFASSVAAAILLFSLMRRVEVVEGAGRKSLWVGVTASAVGLLIWAAHVGGMLAVGAGLDAGFDLRIAGAALVVAVVMVACGVALAAPNLSENGVLNAAAGGAAVGAALLLTHYVGVNAVRLPGRLDMFGTLFLVGGGVAVAASAAAFALAATFRGLNGRMAAGAVFAVGAFAFHALGAIAVDATLDPRVAIPEVAVDHTEALAAAAAAASGLLLFALFAIVLDWRLENRSGSEVDRLQALSDLSSEGLVVCDELKIVDVNVAAARLMGLDPTVLRRRAFRDFIDAPDPDRVLSASLAKPQNALLRTTGGEPLPVEVASRDLQVLGRTRRVFTLRNVSEQRRSETQIRHLAYHDPLTGLANRAAFNEALAGALKRGGEVALFCIDLDRFKEVNDVFGHSTGDEILKTAARRIVAAAPDAMVFRLGGDEFVAIGTGPDAGDADKLARRLTERLNVETVVGGTLIRCGASVGFAVFPHHGSTIDALFANADAALYRAKADGRGLARGFEPDMDLALRERRVLQQDLATAISRNEMFLHWMPQADTVSGEIRGFEALLRWKHPVRGVVPPGVFIPVAEETAAIVPIGEWVLRTACAEAVRWMRPGKVAVNLSPIQFQHGDIVGLVHGILLETGLPAGRLELEITEGVLLHDLPGALSTLRRLKALGVQIAMDDFGTGYSSLSYLQAFPFDRIKIDASFIRTLGSSPQAKAIVRAVVALGASLDMPITAEGVETHEQRSFLAELQCDEIQGYLVGRPSPLVSFDSPFERPGRTRRAS